MVKTKKAGLKAARPETTPAKGEDDPDKSEGDLSEESSPDERRRKLPAKADQQQGKTGTSSDDINPTSPGRHTAYSNGVNTAETVSTEPREPGRFYA